MSEKNWQPGDVAVIVNKNSKFNGQRAMFCDDGQGRAAWAVQSTDGLTMAFGSDLHPLVVLDSEDREQVERLNSLVPWLGAAPNLVDDMQAALRKFANPQSRIEEPQGLGAVVELQEGAIAVRTEGNGDTANWSDKFGDFHWWSDLDVVRVLSEGYEAGESE